MSQTLPRRTWPRGHCVRCDREVDVEVPWVGWQYAKRVWVVSVVFMAIITPVIAADALFLSPLALAFLMGGGALNERAEEVPRCRRCQREISTDSIH